MRTALSTCRRHRGSEKLGSKSIESVSHAFCPGMTRCLLLALGLSLVPHAAHADDDDTLPPLSIYGFARLDVLADDSRMSDVAQPMFVTLEGDHGHLDGEMTMTPRLSRVGLSIDEWELSENWTGEGKVEIDFAGGSGANAIRLRHAYASVSYKKRIELLAGQTADLISPLFPSAQNDTQLLFAGNTGDRRPQVQLAVYPTDKLRLAVAAGTPGWISHGDLDGNGMVDTKTTMRPMLQWLAELRQRMNGDVLRFGVWGHASRDDLPDGTHYSSYSTGIHIYLPIVDNFVWLGEAYMGQNLADIGGGIGQGVNFAAGKQVRGVGGWIEAAALPTKRHMLAIGASADAVYEDDVNMGDRTRNNTFYGVLRYKPRPAIQLGLEYLYWKTLYKDMGEGVANRFDMHLSVFF